MTDSMAAVGHESAKLTLEVYSKPMRLGDRERAALRALAAGPGWGRSENPTLGTAAERSEPLSG